MRNQAEDIFEPAMPVVPQGWDVLPFEQAVEVISDKSKRVKQSAYLPAGKLPVIDQGQDFIGGYTDDEDMAFEGELPVILFGDHTRSIKYVERPFAVGAEGVKILRPSRTFDPKYFFYLLRSLHIPSRGYSRHFQFLRKFHFPRAPLDQQKRIVAEIEKQFSRLDEAVANLKRVKANLKRYKAAVLKAAVEGRLVETEAELARREARSYETGAQLLQRILETRRRQWKGKGKYKEPAAPDTTDLPELPEGWAWATLDQLSVVVRGASPRPAGDPRYFGGSIPWITVGPLTADEQPYLRSAPETVTEEGRERSRYIEAETLLLTNSGATLGVPKITLIGGCINDGVAALLGVDYPIKLYLLYFLRLQTERLRQINQGAAQPNLNTTIIKAICVPLPPIAEQERAIVEVDRRLSLIREVEYQVGSNIKRTESLRQSILARAFSGELFQHVVRKAETKSLLSTATGTHNTVA